MNEGQTSRSILAKEIFGCLFSCIPTLRCRNTDTRRSCANDLVITIAGMFDGSQQKHTAPNFGQTFLAKERADSFALIHLKFPSAQQFTSVCPLALLETQHSSPLEAHHWQAFSMAPRVPSKQMLGDPQKEPPGQEKDSPEESWQQTFPIGMHPSAQNSSP
jgi:hypothetical protein